MRVAEIYSSVQGEGRLTGTPSVFVRASGCNLRCWFCDTPYTSWLPEGEDMSVDEIVSRVMAIGGSHVVLTGGEPMLFSELVPIARQLHEDRWHITIETAGTLDLPVICDLMSISPKLTGSAPDEAEHPKWHHRHETTRHQADVIRRLTTEYDYQLKFVIDAPEDLEDVQLYLLAFPHVEKTRVLLMPQATDFVRLQAIAEWLVPRCQELGFTFCPRRQIEWFGAGRGT
jgi:7-carboxy-7-deazaguanine synthase